MKYTAPDGHVMECNSSTVPVVYSCPISDMVEGNFDSLETTYANNAYGIQQLRINRYITETEATITIRLSTDAELQEYIDSIIRTEPVTVDSNGNLNI